MEKFSKQPSLQEQSVDQLDDQSIVRIDDRTDNQVDDQPADPSRRSAIESIVKFTAAAAVAPGLLVPSEARAGFFENGSSLDYSSRLRCPYDQVVNKYRLKFGRREDYQLGFEAAMRNSNTVIEIDAGMYGILPKRVNPVNPWAITSFSEFPVETAGYLHATQEIKEGPAPLSHRYNQARAEIMEKIGKMIMKKYRTYDRSLLGKIRLPVVTLNNIEEGRIEMFVRIPTPGTTEYFQMTSGRWADYYDQSKLRHEEPFITLYDPSKSLFDNLTTIYGPQLAAFRRAKQKVKNRMAQFIRFTNKRIVKAFGRKYGLDRAQKDIINDWLNVAGTRFAL